MGDNAHQVLPIVRQALQVKGILGTKVEAADSVIDIVSTKGIERSFLDLGISVGTISLILSDAVTVDKVIKH